MFKMEIDVSALRADQLAKIAVFLRDFKSVALSDDPIDIIAGAFGEHGIDNESFAAARAVTSAKADGLGKPERTAAEELADEQRGDLTADANGLPWDVRIHSGTRAVNADGSWRLRRGVDPELVETVEAELRALMASPVAQTPEQAFGAVVTCEPSPVAPPPPPAPVADPEPAAPAVPPAPPTPAAEPQAVTLPDLMTLAARAMTGGKITPAQLSEITQRHGVANVGLLSARPDLVPQVFADLKSHLGEA